MVRNYTPNLSIPHRHQKGLVKLFTGTAGCGIPAPFYYSTDVLREGQPVKLGSSADLVLALPSGEGANVFGLAMQKTYSEANWDPQLKGYHFANNTAQRLDGAPIGVLTGAGYAVTTNTNAAVKWGDQAYIAASGYLAPSGEANCKLPIVFEEDADAGELVRLRFAFKFAPAGA
jgi:hypothetical protein